jgi:phage terminase small subunit
MEENKKEFKLSERQQKFADEYIITLNATKSYLKAYGEHLGYNAAMVSASKLLRNTKVSSYIDERLEDLKSERIADQEEVLEFLTSTMRGEVKSDSLIGVGGGEEAITSDLGPSSAERLKAAELLGKRYSLFTDNQNVNTTITPVFLDDIE